MSDKKTPEATEENGSEEKIVLPSNEEVLEVIETPDEIDVIDVGNKESAKIIEDCPKPSRQPRHALHSRCPASRTPDAGIVPTPGGWRGTRNISQTS